MFPYDIQLYLPTPDLATPPLSPKREFLYYSTSFSQEEKLSPHKSPSPGATALIEFPPPARDFMRLRTKSVNDNEKDYQNLDNFFFILYSYIKLYHTHIFTTYNIILFLLSIRLILLYPSMIGY